MSYLASIIKSLRLVTASNPGNVSVVQVALDPPVDPNNTIIIPLGLNQATSGGLFTPCGFVRWDLIANGTVAQTITGAIPVQAGYARAQVVEFYGNLVKSRGRGSIAIAQNTDLTDLAITPAVVLAKTLITITGQYFDNTQQARFDGATDSERQIQAELYFLNTTTIRAGWPRNPNIANHLPGRIVGYNYLEFR